MEVSDSVSNGILMSINTLIGRITPIEVSIEISGLRILYEENQGLVGLFERLWF